MVEKAIRDILTSDPAITAIVSSRVFLDFARQETLMPYIVFGRFGTERVGHLGGTDGLAKAAIEINLIGESYAVLATLATEVREALASFHGTRKGVRIQNAVYDDEWSTANRKVSGGDFAVYQRQLDFSVWYEETPVPLHN